MPEATQAQVRSEEILTEAWLDPDIGAKLRQLAKKKFPDSKLVDDVVAPFIEPMIAENKSLRERLDKLEEERQAEREKSENNKVQAIFESAIAKARADYNLTDDGFDKMLARMKETSNFTDADAAAAWVVSKTPPPPIKGPVWSPQDLNLFGSKSVEEGMAKLHRDPIGYQDDVIGEFYRDPDKFVRETPGL
jgi:hypothetical protein